MQNTHYRDYFSNQRLALIVGNSKYASNALVNPKNDANGVAAVLQEVGFEVSLNLDTQRANLIESVEIMSRLIQPGAMVLVYFSGHGLQIQDKNYLVPINNNFQDKSETEIARRCVGLHEIEEIILNDPSKSKPALVIFILDACRNNPFPSSSSLRGADLRIAKGLAPVNVNRYDNSTDLLYLFATDPGNVADDAPNEPNGRFTGALLKFLGQAIEIEALCRHVNNQVRRQSAGFQTPWKTGNLRHDYYLAPADGIWRRPTIAVSGQTEFATYGYQDAPGGSSGKPRQKGISSNPYRGLEAFDEENKDYFFGREVSIKRVIDLCRGILADRATSGLIWVLGASGSGKSSLVKAGVIPRLKSGALPNSHEWLYIKFEPAVYPKAIADCLSNDNINEANSIFAELQNPKDDAVLLKEISKKMGQSPQQRCLILVDQFEQLVTQLSEAESNKLIGQLLAAIDDPERRVLAILTLRSDFQNDLLEKHPQLFSSIQTQQTLLAPMQAQDLRTIIEEPAKRVGLEFEDGLVEKLLQETKDTQGSLPLLEYLLQQLGDIARQENHNLMRWDNFHKLGGVAGVLAKQAEQVYDELEKSEQSIARSVLLRLIVPRSIADDAGRTVKALDLWRNTEDDTLIQKVVNKLVAARLLTAERDSNTGDILLSFPHEALIRHWPKLHSWIEENPKDLEIQQRIQEGANQWKLNDQGEGYLWRAEQLAEALSWRQRNEHELSTTERAFLDAALMLKLKLALRESRIRTGLLVLSLASIGAATFSFSLKKDADKARIRAETQQKTILATKLVSDVQNLKLTHNPDRQLTALLSAEALKLKQPFPIADQLLREDLGLLPRRYMDIPRQSISAGADYSTDARYLLIHDWPETEGSNITPARLYELNSKKLTAQFSYSAFNGFVSDKPNLHPLFCPKSDCLFYIKDSHLYKIELPGGIIITTGIQGVSGIASFSPNGKFLLLYGVDLSLQVMDATTGQLLLRIPQSTYRVAVFSADSAALWTIADDNKTVGLIDIKSGNSLTKLHSANDLIGFEKPNSSKFLQTISGIFPDKSTLWDIQSEKPLAFPFAAGKIALSPDDQHAIIWPQQKSEKDFDSSNQGQLWDLNSIKPVSTQEIAGGLHDFAFSAQGDTLIANAKDAVTLWDLSNNKPIRRERHEAFSVDLAIANSPRDGAIAVRHGNDLDLWDKKTGETKQHLQLHDNTHYSELNFANNRSLLLATGWAFSVKLDYGYGTAELLSEMPGNIWINGNEGQSTASPDLAWLFKSAEDKTQEYTPHTIWQMSSKKGIAKYLGAASVKEYFSPDSTRLVAGSQSGLTVTYLSSGNYVKLPESADGWDGLARRFLMTGDNFIDVFDIDSRKVIFEYKPGESPHDQILTDDGKSIVYADDKTIKVFDIGSGKETLQFPHDRQVDSLELSPRGGWLITSNQSKSSFAIWDLKTGKKMGGLSGDAAYAYSRLVVSEDERLMLVGSFDKPDTQILEFPSGKFLHHLSHENKADTHQERFEAEFLQGSTYMITSSLADNTTRVWDTATGAEYRRWPGIKGGIGKDEDTIMTFDDTKIQLWSVKTGRNLAQLEPHIAMKDTDQFDRGLKISAAKLSPDARHVLFTWGQSVHVYEFATGQEISRLQSDKARASVISSGFSPDGNYIAAYLDRELWVSLWRPEDLLEEACQRVSRNLSRKEWQDYIGDEPYRQTCAGLPEPASTDKTPP